MEVTFCDLRSKEVVNIIDGRKLGKIVDIVLDTCCAKITGIVVPGDKKLFNFKNEDLFIPWRNIRKIGDDVILVELIPIERCEVKSMEIEKNDDRSFSDSENMKKNWPFSIFLLNYFDNICIFR